MIVQDMQFPLDLVASRLPHFCSPSSRRIRWSDDEEPDDPEWMDGTGYDDPDAYWDDDRVREAEEELAREAHDLEFILLWEQELQELGHIGHKAGQSRSLTEHIIEDHAEFWCLCLAIPRVYISDSVDEWYDEDTHESE